MNQSFTQISNYPDIIKKSRVRNHKIIDEEDIQIIQNLDSFIQEFNIIDVHPQNLRGNRWRNEVNPWGCDIQFMDHFDFFKREGKCGYVAIFSPYGGLNESLREKMENFGYKPYRNKLYSQDAETWYKEIPYVKMK